jgi:hypothetical protein
MRVAKALLVVLGLALLLAVLVSPTRADTWDKKTVVTFNQPIELPNLTLPAGTYVFKLLRSPAVRHVVQVWNADETKLLGTVLAIPNYRLEPTGETVMNFKERPAGSPQALRAWFYPGDNFGQEFVYPKAKAVQLAQESHVIVPATTTEPTESTLTTVPLVAITPEQKEEPIAKAIQVTPPAPVQAAAAPAQAPAKLPQTGSTIPFIGLLGLVSVGLGIALKMLAKQLS